MKKILFVDDEPAILEGLEDSLRKHRIRWDMTFACGGQAAIDALDNQRFDVIVSDVRMPGVGGIDVLQYARENFPDTIRIALTGFADDTSTVKLTELAQRYLTKPCNVDDLDEAIHRDCGLVEAFDNPMVKELAGSAGRLPAGQSVQARLLMALNSSEGSIDEITSIIEEDPAITAKVLQLANSSFFRRQATIMSARHAVTHVGMDVIRMLVLADQLFEASANLPSDFGLDVSELRQHCVTVSTIANAISPCPEMASVALTAGLLHDVGKIIIGMAAPENVNELVNKNAELPNQWVDQEEERRILGCTHAEVGGYFLNLWGVPTPVVEAVTFHDAPSSVFSREFDPVGIVHVANYLAHWCHFEQAPSLLEHKLDRGYLAEMLVEDQELIWKEKASQLIFDQAA